MSEFDTDLGQRIRDLRQAAGLTQQVLGERLGVTKQSISNIEVGRQSVSAEMLWNIAVFLGVSIGSMFDALLDNATAAAEIRGRLLTAQYHLTQASKSLTDD